jgi:hypothetical protein
LPRSFGRSSLRVEKVGLFPAHQGQRFVPLADMVILASLSTELAVYRGSFGFVGNPEVISAAADRYGQIVSKGKSRC